MHAYFSTCVATCTYMHIQKHGEVPYLECAFSSSADLDVTNLALPFTFLQCGVTTLAGIVADEFEFCTERNVFCVNDMSAVVSDMLCVQGSRPSCVFFIVASYLLNIANIALYYEPSVSDDLGNK